MVVLIYLNGRLTHRVSDDSVEYAICVMCAGDHYSKPQFSFFIAHDGCVVFGDLDRNQHHQKSTIIAYATEYQNRVCFVNKMGHFLRICCIEYFTVLQRCSSFSCCSLWPSIWVQILLLPRCSVKTTIFTPLHSHISCLFTILNKSDL